MQITYDREADALYIRLLAGEYQCRVVGLTEDIALDFATGEKLARIARGRTAARTSLGHRLRWGKAMTTRDTPAKEEVQYEL